MARWAGIIGYISDKEVEPGVWDEIITEKKYTGDLIKQKIFVKEGSDINPSVSISNQISFIADPYALSNFELIRFVSYMGKKWNVTDISFEKPRIHVTLGGLYNGKSN